MAGKGAYSDYADDPGLHRPKKPPVFISPRGLDDPGARLMNARELADARSRVFEANTGEQLLSIRKRLLSQLDYVQSEIDKAKREAQRWTNKRRELRKVLGDWAPGRTKVRFGKASVKQLLIAFLSKSGGPLPMSVLVHLLKESRKRYSTRTTRTTSACVYAALRSNPQVFVRVQPGTYDLRERYLEQAMLAAEPEKSKMLVDAIANELMLEHVERNDNNEDSHKAPANDG